MTWVLLGLLWGYLLFLLGILGDQLERGEPVGPVSRRLPVRALDVG